MRIFRINSDHSCHSLLPAADDFFKSAGAVFSPQPKVEKWKHFGPSGPDFIVRELAKTKDGNFLDLSLGVLVFDDLVRSSAAGRTLAAVGEILPARLEDRGSSLWVCNVLTTYDCFDRERSKFLAAGPVVVQVHEYAFLPDLIGDCSVFKTQVQQNTAIFTIADRGNPEEEFYHQYQEAGFTGLVFQEIWND